MKKILISFALVALALTAAAQEDPIVMRINGVPVPRSEFEYNYNKNNSEGVIDKKSVEEYADLFVNYKLKVQAALDDHLDTLSSYQKEFRQYRDPKVQRRKRFVTTTTVCSPDSKASSFCSPLTS